MSEAGLVPSQLRRSQNDDCKDVGRQRDQAKEGHGDADIDLELYVVEIRRILEQALMQTNSDL